VKRRLPAVYEFKDFVDLGGLIAYGPSLTAMGRRAADYVDKIVKGAKPADLPVEQPTKFELVINLLIAERGEERRAAWSRITAFQFTQARRGAAAQNRGTKAGVGPHPPGPGGRASHQTDRGEVHASSDFLCWSETSSAKR
jgi:ABC transporter substrate binding protein